jgi:GntR family transcriptional regulator/MocR family aminotransferase
MAKTWANGLDLHLDVTGTRVRAKLEASLRAAVRSGRLHPGMRLPSSRTLAADLGVARNTVAEVYSQLVAEGWLTARTGSGTVVAPRSAVPGPDTTAARDPAPPRYDLRPGEPDLSAFPRREWLAAGRKALAAAPDHVLSYPDPRGLHVLRAVLAEYLARARGVAADAGYIVICSGFAHGLAVLCRALRASGAVSVAVEEYGHQLHRDIVAAQGLDPVLLPVSDLGAVAGAVGSADAVLLTPAHQFPLGMTLGPRRRRAFAEWGGIVIEDDYDGEFRYDRQPVGAVQALAPDNVVYAGTASKSLAPAVRIGWLVVPPRLLDAVVAQLDGGPSALDQLTLAEFIASGGYDRQIRRARLAYRRRRDRLVVALDGLGMRMTGIAAGLHAVLDLPSAEAERRVCARAEDHGLALDGLRHYTAAGIGDAGADGARRAGLVIGYGRPPEHAYTTALARLCAVLASSLPVSLP